MADKKFVHVLITASYEDKPLPSHALSHAVSHYLNTMVEVQKVMTYQMPYVISPMQCGLKDVWDNMTDDERMFLRESHLELATAIALMCGDDDEKEKC